MIFAGAIFSLAIHVNQSSKNTNIPGKCHKKCTESYYLHFQWVMDYNIDFPDSLVTERKVGKLTSEGAILALITVILALMSLRLSSSYLNLPRF